MALLFTPLRMLSASVSPSGSAPYAEWSHEFTNVSNAEPSILAAAHGNCNLNTDRKLAGLRIRIYFLQIRVQLKQHCKEFSGVENNKKDFSKAVFRIRIQIRSGFRGLLDPDPEA